MESGARPLASEWESPCRQDSTVPPSDLPAGKIFRTSRLSRASTPGHHRQGLGRLLLQHAEATLLAQYSTIRLESFADNAAANSFYGACRWLHGDRLTGEAPAKIEYSKSGTND
ncbi:GNAT family N-acetyltransferase [Streptomyces sp. NPDC000410]|uniref:GNAT family N-acetyltransferase n=1 Tax=Streptomyces sp. NPDC000410 TaxID=3154254 RepID=UPI0033279A57